LDHEVDVWPSIYIIVVMKFHCDVITAKGALPASMQKRTNSLSHRAKETWTIITGQVTWAFVCGLFI
jgi:hypothetical protein